MLRITPAVFAFWLCILPFGPSVFAASAAPLPPGSQVAILPAGGDAHAPDELKRKTTRAVKRALIEMRYKVLAPDVVSQKLTAMGRDPCRVLRTCHQASVLEALDVDAVASVALWLGEGGQTPQQVVVRITRREGWGTGDAEVDGAGLANAVGAALALALSESEKRREILLRVEAEPAHAHIEVDHKRVAAVPAEIAVLPGKRIVKVSAEGYVTESRYVDVPAESPQPFVYRVSLSPNTDQTPDTAQTPPAYTSTATPPLTDDSFESTPQKQDSAWNYIMGGTLAAASVPLLAFPFGTLVAEGECIEEDIQGRCERYEFGTQSALLLAGGLVALGGGVTFLLVKPIKTRRTPPATQVTLGARPDGLVITGEF